MSLVRKIRILYCVETISSGGVEQTRLTLAKYFSKDQYELKLTCSYAGGPIAEALESEGVELIQIGSMRHPFDFRVHNKAINVIREFQPDIIHGGVFEGNSVAALSGSLMRVPVRILEETSDPQNRSLRASWLLKQYSKCVDIISAISPSVKEYLINSARIQPEKVRLINNGVPIPVPIPWEDLQKLKLRLGIKEDEIIIGYVGRFYNDHKRMTVLLQAIQILKNLNIKLLMIGDGRDRTLVDSTIKEFGLSQKVILEGFQKDPNPYYEIMNIFCVPSEREGFGLVAVEAMLHGLPVIGTNVGGLKDIIIEGETGFLISKNSPESIAEKIKILIENLGLRRSMGENGKQRALMNYTSKRYCNEIENLYLELLKRKKINLTNFKLENPVLK